MVQNTAVATMLCCSLAKVCQYRLVAPNCWLYREVTSTLYICTARKPCPTTDSVSPSLHWQNSASGVRNVPKHTWLWVPYVWDSKAF